MTTLTKEQAKAQLISVLTRDGVKASAAEVAADGFLLDLEEGRSLHFRDVGTLHMQEGAVVVSAQPAGMELGVGTRRYQKQLTRPRVLEQPPTLSDEAATRHFEQGGYPRREAERAVQIGRSRRRAG
ncbi:hypothetical protein K7W42_12810 [Deinococcus sp. HMF7604]|uniref:hypothetical protein n=1 Tax=Deinococcus betulae TaxID=2873312 RepID=UPI001CC9D21B|nr:hypothetical protein [Deinococcus betulae]MBZ9751740.1 hypothetical protein [Deinococcus betulae]